MNRKLVLVVGIVIGVLGSWTVSCAAQGTDPERPLYVHCVEK